MGRTIKHIYLHNMNFFTILLPILLLVSAVKTETFADKLAVFIGETPTGYTVTQMEKDGEKCHCRVPGSSSSSSAFIPTTVAGSSALTTEADATTDATTDVTTTDATTTDATTTDATTTDATKTDATTTDTTTGTTTGTGSSAFAADSDLTGSALTADFDTTGSAAGRR